LPTHTVYSLPTILFTAYLLFTAHSHCVHRLFTLSMHGIFTALLTALLSQRLSDTGVYGDWTNDDDGVDRNLFPPELMSLPIHTAHSLTVHYPLPIHTVITAYSHCLYTAYSLSCSMPYCHIGSVIPVIMVIGLMMMMEMNEALFRPDN
jgi:hypothetical protein